MSWETKTLEDITVVITKGTTPTTLGRPFTETGINFIKAESLNGDSSLDSHAFAFIDEETHYNLKRSILKVDDVLVTIAGAQVGRCGITRAEHLPANTNQAVGIVRVDKEKANPNFVYYFFKLPSTFSMCQSVGTQSAQPNVNLTSLKRFQISLPKRCVQDQIVKRLSVYDELIMNNRRRIALLEKAARLLYQEWFVLLRFPGHEHTTITNGIPEGWQDWCVSDFGQVITGKTPSTKMQDNYGEGVPFIKTPDMHDNVYVLRTESSLTEKGANTQSGKFIPTNTLLVSCIGTIGVVSLTSERSQFNQQINAVITFDDSYRYYCFFAFKDLKEQMEAISGGATMGNVNKGKFQRLRVVKPVTSLLREFKDVCDPMFRQILVLSRQNEKLRSTRDLLLPRLMNGEVEI